MAVQAFPFLQLTDGTDTVTFADGAGGLTNYPPVRGTWAPAVSGLRTSQLAGRGPYADVAEDLSCNIRDTTAALAYSRLDTLARLLDKAERWWLRNELISPVILKYVPQGSTIHASGGTVMQAIVLGRVGADELDGVFLPPSANDAGMLFEIDGVKIKCLRRGAWTGASDASATSGSAANATVLSRSFATHPINSPVDVVIGGFTVATTPTIPAGYLMVGSGATDISVYEAEAIGAVAPYSTVADAAALARGGSVLRYTPAGTTLITTSGTANLGVALTGASAIIAAVRNNSGTTSFQLSAVLSGYGNTVSTPPVTIDTSSLLPRLVLLGTVVPVNATGLAVAVQASAAAGTLDIDYLIVVNLRNETVAVIAHDAIATSSFTAGAFTLQALWNPTTDQYPVLRAASGVAGVTNAAYRGPLPLLTTGDAVFALWTATNGAFWRMTTVANAIVNVTLQATRYRSYLTPQ
jgi:hypothetical protein